MFKLRHWWWWWWYFKLYRSTIFTNIGQSWKTKVNVSVGQSQIMLLAQHWVVFIKKFTFLFITKQSTKLEKAMAPHSSTLAWRIPWKEEPGGLQSMGSQRVRHHWATSLSLFTFMHWRRKWQPTPVFLPGESQGRRAWWAAVYGKHRVRHDWRDLAAAKHKTVNPLWTISNTK